MLSSYIHKCFDTIDWDISYNFEHFNLLNYFQIKLTCNNSNEMFHKFDHYGKVNCVNTRVYASLPNKYKDIDSLSTLQ